jgi:DNA-binding response OmpR family regulator
MRTIFIVSQQGPLTDLVEAYLNDEGLQMVAAADGQEAIIAAQREEPDLILLDLMMADKGGYELLRRYAETSDTPLFLLLNSAKQIEKVPGQRTRANGRTGHQLSSEELAARIHGLLCCFDEAWPETQPRFERAARVKLDRVGRTVSLGDKRVDLTPTEFNLLATLMSAPGRAFSRRDLLVAIQGHVLGGCERTIDVHVSNLRTKMEPDPSHPRYVQTVYGIGYRFAVEDGGV